MRAERPRERDGGIEARAVLVEDHDLEGFRVLDRAFVGLLLAGEEAQQRALAAAVRAQQAESRAGTQHQVEPAHDPPLAVAVRDVLRDQQALGPPLRRREVDVDRGRLRARVEVAELVLEPLGLVDPRLGLARAGAGLAREPVELAAHAVPERLLVGGLAGEQLVLLLEVAAVAAAHVEEARGEGAVQLDHAPGDGFEEVAVVAHRDEGLGLARQQLLEPEDAVDVEVVGGLVEQQQLGLAHELARDGEPLLPAARERLRLLRLVREAGPSHRDGDLAVALVRVEPLVGERLAQHRADARARRSKAGSCGT